MRCKVGFEPEPKIPAHFTPFIGVRAGIFVFRTDFLIDFIGALFTHLFLKTIWTFYFNGIDVYAAFLLLPMGVQVAGEWRFKKIRQKTFPE